MAFDRDELLWYGTTIGAAYISNPYDATAGEAYSIVPEYEGDDLLENQQVNGLAVDGGNRKWMATSEGLWLFNEEGEQLIYHFTEDNSPLLSDSIYDIAINEESGEVFFATSKGLVSYRSNASAGKVKHSQVKIFPNPVRQGYQGEIAISGLVENARVKITDLSGNLVRETLAQGGTATWNGNTLSGARVNTGVYLVFSASSDGKESYVGKIAVIR